VKIVSFVSSKGGVGKSTLCFNVAVAAAKDHKVFIGDLDPQKSLKALWERRGQISNPRLVTSIKDIGQTAKLLVEAGHDREYMMLDTPGSLMEVIHGAVINSHCIVLPVQPSKLDWLAQEAVADMVDEVGLSDRVLFVVNKVEANDATAEEAKAFFASRAKHPIITIRRRPEYVRGFDEGITGAEATAAAAKEIGTLWRAIQRVLDPQAKSKPAPAPRQKGRLILNPGMWGDSATTGDGNVDR
jgi:chromosome partitioning protein